MVPAEAWGARAFWVAEVLWRATHFVLSVA